MPPQSLDVFLVFLAVFDVDMNNLSGHRLSTPASSRADRVQIQQRSRMSPGFTALGVDILGSPEYASAGACAYDSYRYDNWTTVLVRDF